MTDTTREALRLALRDCLAVMTANGLGGVYAAQLARAALATPEQAPAVQAGALELAGWQMKQRPTVLYPPDWKPTDINNFRPVYALATTPAVQAEQTAGVVAWCALTPSGQIAYFDGKPMVMPGPVGNEHHPVPLYATSRGQAEDAPEAYHPTCDVTLRRAGSGWPDFMAPQRVFTPGDTLYATPPAQAAALTGEEAPSQPAPAEPTHIFEPRDLSYDIWVDQHRGRQPRHEGRVISIVCAKCGRYEDHPTHQGNHHGT
jgi:hypothetical protein